MTGYTFGCGHPLTRENSIKSGARRGIPRLKCATCNRERLAQERAAKRSGTDQRSLAELSHAKAMEHGSSKLLSAIKREHPYVIQTALRDGRIAA